MRDEVGRIGVGAALDVVVDRPADDGAGADDRHWAVRSSRLRGLVGQDAGLGPGLDLEHPDGVAPPDAVVHLLVLEVDAGEVDVGAPMDGAKVEALLHQRQHAQRQEVDRTIRASSMSSLSQWQM